MKKKVAKKRRAGEKTSAFPEKKGKAPSPSRAKKGKEWVPKKDWGSFAERVRKRMPLPSGNQEESQVEWLAGLDYPQELDIKNAALRDFWHFKKLPGRPEKIVPSPRPRNYRTTTKRRVVYHDERFCLTFSDENIVPRVPFSDSSIEPPEHAQLYRFLLEQINLPRYHLLGENLNYLIIRGNYTEFCVIFNMHTVTSLMVKKIKQITEEMKKLPVNLISVFLYLDPSQSDYYLESRRPEGIISFKKIFGPNKLFVKFNGKKYSFSPVAFSQVNESMVPVMLEEMKKMLQPNGQERLFDLYCGYGIFSHSLAEHYLDLIGVDYDEATIQSAIENSHYGEHLKKMKFHAQRIMPDSLSSIFPEEAEMGEVFILDPPRIGTEEGVLETIASRHPSKILHIFCKVDHVPQALEEWARFGYQVSRIVPLDMFPGSPNLEVMILLTPQSLQDEGTTRESISI